MSSTNPYEALPGSNLNQFGQIGQAPIPNINKPQGPGYYYDQASGNYLPSAKTTQYGSLVGPQIAQTDLSSNQNKLTAQDQSLSLQKQLAASITGIIGGGAAGGGVSGSSFPSVSFGGGGGSSGTFGGGAVPSIGGAAGGSVPNIAPAQNAAFARAKDTAGSLARSSVSSLNDEMAGRGALGSTMTNNGLADRIASATNTLGNVDSAQLGDAYTAASHQQDLANQNQQTAYQGAITQRGQDISLANASAALAQQKQMALLSALNGLTGASAGGSLY